jgi:hypothetical protein
LFLSPLCHNPVRTRIVLVDFAVIYIPTQRPSVRTG